MSVVVGSKTTRFTPATDPGCPLASVKRLARVRDVLLEIGGNGYT